MQKIIRIVALLLSLTFLLGCEVALIGAGAGLGIGAYKYIEGSVNALYSLSYNSAWNASNTALTNLSISVTNSINEGIQGTIEAVRKDGTSVTIRLKDMGQNVTEISVRVGFLGNREDAMRIHKEIKTIAGLK